MGPGQEHITEQDTSLSIPKLSLDGLNWVTFKTHFLYAMGGRDVEGHFDGSDKAPPQLTLSTSDESKWTTADNEMRTTLGLSRNGSMTRRSHMHNWHRHVRFASHLHPACQECHQHVGHHCL